jgi:hypothetical protein
LLGGEHAAHLDVPPANDPDRGSAMRRLVEALVVVSCLAACSGNGEAITDVDDGPVGGVYSLRQISETQLPLYFWPYWYPGRSSVPGSLSATLMSAELTIRRDGKFTWTTLVEESVAKPNSSMLEYVSYSVRRDAYGTWTYTPSTGVVTLEGLDQFGEYVLTGSMTGTVLTLSSTAADRPYSRFLLER